MTNQQAAVPGFAVGNRAVPPSGDGRGSGLVSELPMWRLGDDSRPCSMVSLGSLRPSDSRQER